MGVFHGFFLIVQMLPNGAKRYYFFYPSPTFHRLKIHFVTYVKYIPFDASHHKLDQKQMTEEIIKQNVWVSIY